MSKKINWASEIHHIQKEKGFINICYEALDRHVEGPLAQAVALRYVPSHWVPGAQGVRDITYAELALDTVRMAHGLRRLGLQKGDVVASLSPRIPELYTVGLGALRAAMVFAPLFSAFGEGPIEVRMKRARAKVIFSTASLYQKKIAPIRKRLPDLRYVILIDDGNFFQIPGAMELGQFLRDADETYFVAKTQAMDRALLHFTSGTTGMPKGAVHVHQALVYHKHSGEEALGLKAEDIFWCTADPGWVTGASYGIISPLILGATLIVDGGEFNATRWYQILQHFKVAVWYTAPTALRMLMKAGEELPKGYDFSGVRSACSVGEPLNPEVIRWVQKHLGISFHDNWWQTETGGIIVANRAYAEAVIGSMGKPICGVEVELVKDSVGDRLHFSEVGEVGELVIRKDWPAVFVEYLDEPERYEGCFVGDWYFSGDLARRDSDGYYWFIGRKDDVIKTSGHLIGPFEVESVLMEHSEVLESAVIGLPDPLIGEKIKAYVVLKKDVVASDELMLEILASARKKLGASLAPREMEFLATLPKTRSGKILRRLLRARELGLPEGDLSTLESESEKR
jgi:acetyl-CoA synthetase